MAIYTETQKLDYQKAEEVYRTRKLNESYWPGAELDDHEMIDMTIVDWLRRAADEVPDRLAVVEGIDSPDRREWTYAELLRDSETIAKALLCRYAPGSRIAIMAPNVVEWAILQYGIQTAGMILVTLNPAYQVKEIEHILKTAEVEAIFTLKEFRGNRMMDTVNSIRDHLPSLKEVLDMEKLPEFMKEAKDVDLPVVKLEDPAVIMFTSGTTGVPRGAVLYHYGMTNSTRFMALRAGLEEGGVWVNVMPMFHMGGNGFTALGCLQQQATHVLVQEFIPTLWFKMVEAYKGTYSLLVPTMVEAVLNHPDRKKYDMSSLKGIQSGASKVERWLAETVKKFGIYISIVCGQTETHGGYTQTHLDDDVTDQVDTIGQPYPQIDFKIGDKVTGKVVPLGVEGEICVRGYQCMLEYYNDPESTAATIDKAGWLHSGDLGTMDERGFVKITGRLKEMLIRGGVNIYPAEIENLLKDYPKVSKVAIVGVPDDYWGEQVAAIVIPKSAEDKPTIEELDEYCLENIARFKRPRFYGFVEEFPYTATGKLRKFQFKEDIDLGKIQLQEVAHKEEK